MSRRHTAWLLLWWLQERQIINNALTREVMRVHRQLQHAALQLKGQAQLPALQAWDAAFSQVRHSSHHQAAAVALDADVVSLLLAQALLKIQALLCRLF